MEQNSSYFSPGYTQKDRYAVYGQELLERMEGLKKTVNVNLGLHINDTSSFLRDKKSAFKRKLLIPKEVELPHKKIFMRSKTLAANGKISKKRDSDDKEINDQEERMRKTQSFSVSKDRCFNSYSTMVDPLESREKKGRSKKNGPFHKRISSAMLKSHSQFKIQNKNDFTLKKSYMSSYMPPREEPQSGDMTKVRRKRMKSFQEDIKENELYERSQTNLKKKIIKLKKKIYKHMAPNRIKLSRKENCSNPGLKSGHSKSSCQSIDYRRSHQAKSLTFSRSSKEEMPLGKSMVTSLGRFLGNKNEYQIIGHDNEDAHSISQRSHSRKNSDYGGTQSSIIYKNKPLLLPYNSFCRTCDKSIEKGSN
ncbi:unnamed protein product [Moneuplotes crassus]|uniref:Uncharacterized protein n=1 Tax=Euplotes crassus TaxID=5936 RepID=A0AAD1Y1N7_EUPCR|nr:unnamed protein product [Moneuplotes crassus]